MSLHEEVLARQQRAVLSLLGPPMASEGCYLGGGTAVALQLGHRRSVDFDWFATRPLGDLLLLAAGLEAKGVAFVVERAAAGTLNGRVRSVPVSILEYPYPLIGPLVPWPEHGFQLASLDDLAAMKLSAITQRGAKKDFVDIYAMATTHRPLRDLLATYRQKYGIADIAHILYGLLYFDDADRQPMPKMLWDMNWRTIKVSIREWVREIAR